MYAPDIDHQHSSAGRREEPASARKTIAITNIQENLDELMSTTILSIAKEDLAMTDPKIHTQKYFRSRGPDCQDSLDWEMAEKGWVYL